MKPTCSSSAYRRETAGVVGVETRRQGEGLLRTREDEVQRPAVGVYRGASRPCDRVHQEQRILVAVYHLGDGVEVVQNAGRGLGVHDRHGVMAALGQSVGDALRLMGRTPRCLEHVRLHATGSGDLRESSREGPVDQTEHASTHAVPDSRLHEPAGGRRRDEHGAIGAEDRPQTALQPGHQLLDLGSAVADDRSGLGNEHRDPHLGGPRQEEATERWRPVAAGIVHGSSVIG
jgi:hypothetical protein